MAVKPAAVVSDSYPTNPPLQLEIESASAPTLFSSVPVSTLAPFSSPVTRTLADYLRAKNPLQPSAAQRFAQTPPSPGQPLLPAIPTAGTRPNPTQEGVRRIVTASTGVYAGGRYTGRITGLMVVPNLESAIALLTGNDIASFRRLPLVRNASFSGAHDGGELTYFLQTPGIVSRNLGYRITTSTSRRTDGVTVSWHNSSSPQPSTEPGGGAVTVQTSNNGSWALTLVPGYSPPVYRVVWEVRTQVNPGSVPALDWAVPDGVITNTTNENTRNNFTAAARLIRGFR